MPRSHLTFVALCALVAIAAASAPSVPVQKLNKDLTHDYCWCLDSHTVPNTKTCVASCNSQITCNGHGTCTPSGACNCDPKYSGEFCESCAGNRASSSNSTLLCDVCAPGYYGPACDVKCDPNTCPGGKCDAKTGACACPEGKKGYRCGVCDIDKGYYMDGKGGCAFCDDMTNCSRMGFCIDRIQSTDPYCLCPPPFSGVRCDACLNSSLSFADGCGVSRLKGAAAGNACEPPDLMLPVLIAIILSVVIIAALLAGYIWYVKKKAADATTKAFQDDFGNDDDVATQYNKF